MIKPTKSTPYTICLSAPVMTKERFEEESGLRIGQIESQISRGNLAIFRLGRLVLINIAKMLHEEAALSIIPVMTFERFALVSGLRERQVSSQVDLENIPSTYIGRLRVVDIARLTTMCLEEDQPSEG